MVQDINGTKQGCKHITLLINDQIQRQAEEAGLIELSVLSVTNNTCQCDENDNDNNNISNRNYNKL